MSARVAVAAGAGVVVVGGAAFLVWRARRSDAEGVDVSKPKEAAPVLVSQSEDSQVIGYINGVPSSITLRTIGNGKKLRADAADKFNAMAQAAARDGVTLHVNSGFRSQEEQKHLHDGYIGTGTEAAPRPLPGFNMAARPGFSNHQGGISVDISTGALGYESAVYKWLIVNARRFGFVDDVRPTAKSKGEAWHWTFKPTAAALLK